MHERGFSGSLVLLNSLRTIDKDNKFIISQNLMEILQSYETTVDFIVKLYSPDEDGFTLYIRVSASDIYLSTKDPVSGVYIIKKPNGEEQKIYLYVVPEVSDTWEQRYRDKDLKENPDIIGVNIKKKVV